MTVPTQSGWQHLPGGYQPPSAPGQPAAAPLPIQSQMPQRQQPQPQPLRWQPPGPLGAPIEGTPPIYPQVPVQGQQPQPFQQQVAAPPAGTDLNARVDGPNVPNELRGKTLAEVMQVYNGMRNVVLQTIPGPVPPSAPGIQQPPSVQQPSAIPPGGQLPAWDWRNPEAGIEAAVERAIDKRVMPALNPLLVRQGVDGIREARNMIAAEIPNFPQIEAAVLQKLQGADPIALQNPNMWRITAHSVIGEMALRGQLSQPAPTVPAGAQQVAPGAQPIPNLNGFFSEQPTVGGAPGGTMQLTPQQAWAAQQMGMTADDYAAWSGGVSTGGLRR